MELHVQRHLDELQQVSRVNKNVERNTIKISKRKLDIWETFQFIKYCIYQAAVKEVALFSIKASSVNRIYRNIEVCNDSISLRQNRLLGSDSGDIFPFRH